MAAVPVNGTTWLQQKTTACTAVPSRFHLATFVISLVLSKPSLQACCIETGKKKKLFHYIVEVAVAMSQLAGCSAASRFPLFFFVFFFSFSRMKALVLANLGEKNEFCGLHRLLSTLNQSAWSCADSAHTKRPRLACCGRMPIFLGAVSLRQELVRQHDFPSGANFCSLVKGSALLFSYVTKVAAVHRHLHLFIIWPASKQTSS